MKQLHDQEREQFKKLFKQEGIDRFDDRYAVLEAFLQTEGHVTMAELTQRLSENGHDFQPAFLRETLRQMCDFGFARQNQFEDGQISYEHRHLGDHHDHLICTKCHKIVEFTNDEMESLQLKIAEANGFHMLQHRMEIYGICAECAKDRAKRMPLTMAKPGEKLKILDFSGGSSARMRLTAMGFRIGDEIEVVTNQNTGQLVIALDFKRYILGRGLAQKITVTPFK
ncbi:MAG: transcriptional repressor [Thermodesulfobacteriota bacterium]